MAKGWTCARCSTKNDATGVTCTGCGLFRGSVVLPSSADAANVSAPDTAATPETTATPADAVPGWTPPDGDLAEASSASVPIWRRIPVGWLVVAGFLILSAVSNWASGAARSDSGEITKSGDLTAAELRVGDCFDVQDPEATEIETVTARPCTEEHEFETFFVGSMPAGDYPADAEFDEYVTSSCGAAFAAYVGRDFQESQLAYYWLSPTGEAWRAGDRTIQCAIYDPRERRLTESLRGANR